MPTPLPKPVDTLIDELYKSANNTNKKKIDELVRTLHANMVPATTDPIMSVESMVASRTKNPMVIFKWGAMRGELSPVQARSYCLQILEAAEAATQDAALYYACTTELKLDEMDAFRMITAVRDGRRRFEESGE